MSTETAGRPLIWATGLGLLGLGWTLGWITRAFEAPASTPAQVVLREPTREFESGLGSGLGEPSPPELRTKTNSPALERDCWADLSRTQHQLDRARADVYACIALDVPWPDNLAPDWSPDGFQSALDTVLDRLEIAGEVSLHCDEFPCIAQLPNDSDRNAIRDALAEHYAERTGETPVMYVKGHTIVGNHGHQALRFVAATPPGLSDEYVQERIQDRAQDLIQAHAKRMRLEAQASPAPPPPPPPP